MLNHKRENQTPQWEINEIPIYINDYTSVDLVIQKPEQARAVFMETWPDDLYVLQEQWVFIALDKYNKVIGTRPIQTGHVTPQNLDSGFLLTAATVSGAERIIIARNEPLRSRTHFGNDLKVLQLIHTGLRLLNIPIVDFLILYANNCFSFIKDLRDEEPDMPLYGYKAYGEV